MFRCRMDDIVRISLQNFWALVSLCSIVSFVHFFACAQVVTQAVQGINDGMEAGALVGEMLFLNIIVAKAIAHTVYFQS